MKRKYWGKSTLSFQHCYRCSLPDGSEERIGLSLNSSKNLHLLKESRWICLNTHFQNYSTHTWRNFLYIFSLPLFQHLPFPWILVRSFEPKPCLINPTFPWRGFHARDRWQNWTPRHAALFWQHMDGVREQGTSTQVRGWGAIQLPNICFQLYIKTGQPMGKAGSTKATVQIYASAPMAFFLLLFCRNHVTEQYICWQNA